MVKLKRWFRHAFMPPWSWRLAFPRRVLDVVEKAVKQSETKHRGELRLAIENALAPSWVWHGMNSRHRALEVFSNLRVWDTEENCGVLIYINLADREVDIVADRGIDKRVPDSEWDEIAKQMRQEFSLSRFEQGSLLGIEAITRLLSENFPAGAVNHDELPNRPVIIKR